MKKVFRLMAIEQPRESKDPSHFPISFRYGDPSFQSDEQAGENERREDVATWFSRRNNPQNGR